MKFRHSFFHGDIKTNNIFIDLNGSGFIASDTGSLVLINQSSQKKKKPKVINDIWK
jgi:hypothetical protein